MTNAYKETSMYYQNESNFSSGAKGFTDYDDCQYCAFEND